VTGTPAAIRPASPAQAGELADRIAAAVAACPGVAKLAGGPLATYLPGRAVQGVAVNDRSVDVAVVARYGPPLTEVADQVRAAVAGIVAGVPINVSITDLDPSTEDGEASDG
jgi:uncharacterized alkaline shock family protein YloU